MNIRLHADSINNYLETSTVKICNGDESSSYHPKWYSEVLARAPQRVRVDDRDAPVSYGEQTPVLHEYHRDVTGQLSAVVVLLWGLTY